MYDNRFVFICPMFNASKTLETLLHSITGQSYKDWKLILIDDVSDVHERAHEEMILSCTFQTYSDKITTIWNVKKRWETFNVLYGISMCEKDDIICRIDADDYLTDLDSLYIINECYKQTSCDVAWTAHRWGFSDKNISNILPEQADVYKYPWVTSHFKTFRKKLIDSIPFENFTNMDGELVKRCGDQAIYLPVLHKAKKKTFIPRVMYHYTIDDVPATYQTEDAVFQKNEAEFIRARGYVNLGPTWEDTLETYVSDRENDITESYRSTVIDNHSQT